MLYKKKFQQNQVEPEKETLDLENMTHFEAFRTNFEIERSDCCWFLGDYYLRPEKMRLQKKYTICLQFHIIVLFRVLESSLILFRQVTMWSQLTKLPKEIYLPRVVYL